MKGIFDKIYVSSYKQSERLPKLQETLANLDIPFEIVYGKSWEEIDTMKMIEDNLLTPKLCHTLCSRLSSKSCKRYVANYFTHVEIWKRIQNGKDKKVLIVEDDVQFFFDTDSDYFKKLFQDEPSDWELIQLGWEFSKPNAMTKPLTFSGNWNFLPGAFCYAIKKGSTEKLLRHAIPQSKAIDGYLHFISSRNQSPFIPLNTYVSNRIMAVGLSQNNAGIQAIYKKG